MKDECEGMKYDSKDVFLTSRNYDATIRNRKKLQESFVSDLVPRLESQSGNIR